MIPEPVPVEAAVAAARLADLGVPRDRAERVLSIAAVMGVKAEPVRGGYALVTPAGAGLFHVSLRAR
jgi:hypothetical protein